MILLDTHSLVWWVNEDQKLSASARAAIAAETASGQICVSCITTWEIALLTKAGRLPFTASLEIWLAGVEAIPNLTFVAIGNEIARGAVNLPEPFHKDPADRLIVATARELACPIVTADEKIRAYPHVRAIW